VGEIAEVINLPCSFRTRRLPAPAPIVGARLKVAQAPVDCFIPNHVRYLTLFAGISTVVFPAVIASASTLIPVLERTENYDGSAAMGGASTASTRAYSVNPAILAWTFPEAKSVSLTPNGKEQVQSPVLAEVGAQFTGVFQEDGPDLAAFSQTASYALGSNTAMRVNFGEVTSNQELDRLGFSEFEYDEQAIKLDIAHRVGNWAIGLTARIANGELSSDLPEKELFLYKSPFTSFRALQPPQEYSDLGVRDYGFDLGIQGQLTSD
jgi:hypothetical protein